MAIVPFKLWEEMKRWKEEQIQKPRLPPDPNVSATANLQRDLSSVLASENLSEGEKSQLYGQTLHQFQTAHRKALEITKLQLPESISSKINQRIMDSVPTTMKKKARLFMSMLQDHHNLSWDEDGTVKIYGQPIPGSNIIDLVNGVLRQRKGIEPTEWQPFAEGLKAMNVPLWVIQKDGNGCIVQKNWTVHHLLLKRRRRMCLRHLQNQRKGSHILLPNKV